MDFRKKHSRSEEGSNTDLMDFPGDLIGWVVDAYKGFFPGKRRREFINNFGSINGNHWKGDIKKWIRQAERGTSISTPGHFDLNPSDGVMRARLYKMGEGGRVPSYYAWRIPIYRRVLS